jgi:hypothetical protein
MKEFIKVISIFVIIFGISFTILYFVDKDRKICDERVTMKDGTVHYCAETASYENITVIRGCDGSKIKVPTNDIKIIENIKKK